MQNRKEISTREDIEVLMKQFYSDLFLHDDMKKVFEGINLEQHLPHIVHFWSFVLLDEEGYKTNVFEKHLNLPIQAHQFDTWLYVFKQAVDSLFFGKKAELAKQRASVLAITFKNKWQAIKSI